MGKKGKQGYLERIYARYRKASKEQKQKILDEFCEVCGYHRKHAIRLLKNRPRRSTQKRKQTAGRKPVYQVPEISEPLKKIWIASDYLCGKRLKAALPHWLPHYAEQHGALETSVYSALLKMSAASIDRVLKPIKAKHTGRRGLSGTKPGTLLKNQIPIKTHHWDVTQPGFLEADTVAHCGNSLAGDFVWSLTMTDILTTWTECRATWNKGSQGVCAQVNDIEKKLPFPLKGFDCDNGSELLNHHFVRYFSDRPKEKSVQFTRSRPYHKDDNAHVEQKNWTHVRQCFGYDRFDNPILVDLMNELYVNEWSLYQNHFCPSNKLIEKTKINSKYRRKYDQPQTPYHRVLGCPGIENQTKENLIKIHNSLNPFKLKAAIESKLKIIFDHVKVTSNVRQRI